MPSHSHTSISYVIKQGLFKLLGVRLLERIERWCAACLGKGIGTASLAEEVAAALRCCAGDSLVVLDIGANKGLWAAQWLQQAGARTGRLLVLEPSTAHRDSLAPLSNNPQVTLLPLAVSDKAGNTTLYADVVGSGLASLHERDLRHVHLTVPYREAITTITIDTLLAAEAITHVDFMKMDIEGHELQALRGAALSLRAGIIKALSFEFGGANIDSRTYFRDFWHYLTPLGYKIFRVAVGGALVPITAYHEGEEVFSIANYIARYQPMAAK